jgi:hypothetical protein
VPIPDDVPRTRQLTSGLGWRVFFEPCWRCPFTQLPMLQALSPVCVKNQLPLEGVVERHSGRRFGLIDKEANQRCIIRLIKRDAGRL